MSGFLIEGAQRAAPLLLNLVTEKGRFSPFLVPSFLHVVGVRDRKIRTFWTESDPVWTVNCVSWIASMGGAYPH